MHGGTLEDESLIFERENFGSGGRDGGVFEMYQDLVSSE